MFSIMGNCMSWIKKRRQPGKKLTLAILGLDNAGKTVTTKGLQGDSLDTVAPTVGFSTVDFAFEKNDITLFDLGGGKRIRDIWKNYFSEVYGLIYVVDSTDPERMEECRQVLVNLLEHPKVSGKPILLLANKQDLHGAMDELDVCQQLNLEEVVNLNKCPCRVEACAAILGQGRKLDKSIKNGMQWLLHTISDQWEKLDARVNKDIAEQREREKQERKERVEIVRKIREEREKKEREERRLRGEPETEDEDEDLGNMKNGDPFKRVDVDELARKEEKAKEEKKRSKQMEMELAAPFRSRRTPQLDSDDEERPAPKAYRSHSRSHATGSQEKIVPSDEDNDRHSLHSRGQKKSSKSYRSRTPSPENPPSLNRRAYRSASLPSDDEDESYSLSAKRSPWLKKRSPRPTDGALPAISPRISGRSAEDDDVDAPSGGRGRMLMPIGHLEPLDGSAGVDNSSLAGSEYRVEVRKKRKKKKTKRNQVATAEDEVSGEMEGSTGSDTFTQDQGGWGSYPGLRPHAKASRSPRLEAQMEEPENEPDSFAQRWGLAEDLPDMPNNASYRRARPNMDSDNEIVT